MMEAQPSGKALGNGGACIVKSERARRFGGDGRGDGRADPAGADNEAIGHR